MRTPEADTSSDEHVPFLEAPIVLHPRLTLTEDDIEAALDPNALSNKTQRFLVKDGYPTNYFDAEARVLFLMIFQENGAPPDFKAFRIKEDSPFIQTYAEVYKER